jgi:uncharacterized membrane protein YdjX (TVP38/TMEM64 family)
MRFVPIPFSLSCYALGTFSVRLRDLIIGNLATVITHTMWFYIGSEIEEVSHIIQKNRKKGIPVDDSSWLKIILPIIQVILLIVLICYLTSKAKRLLKNASAKDMEGQELYSEGLPRS